MRAATLFIAALGPAAAAAAAAVKETLLMYYETGAPGSGAMPCSLALAKHASGPPTATVAQYLNDPIGVQAFSAAAGADSPLWSFWPESTDMDLSWQLAGSAAAAAPGAVDTVVVQYSNEQFTSEDANCTLWGVSTAPNATVFSPLWTATVPHCDVSLPVGANYGQVRSIAITADGATVVASLFLSGSQQVLMGWELASGKQLFFVPTAGFSYGVELSADGKWAVVAADDGRGGRTAFVYSTATGVQRGDTGCIMAWNAPPALSADGAVIASGDQNGMILCAWDEGQNAYGAFVRVAMPSRGE